MATEVSLATGPDLVWGPCGVWSAGGHLYVADATTVRKVASTDWLTTVAGTGNEGAVGDGGPAVRATLLTACGVTTDHAGNVVLADDGQGLPYGFRVRVVAARSGTMYGQAMTAGDIYTVAGNGTEALGSTGVPATQTELSNPVGVAVDGHGNLVISDGGFRGAGRCCGARLRVVAARAGTFYGKKMIAGDIYTVAGTKDGTGYSGDGGPATMAGLGDITGDVAVDGAGNLVLAGIDTNRIRVVAARSGTFYGQAMTAGDIYTVAGDGTEGFSGDGGPAPAAEINRPYGVAVDAAGDLMISDTGNNRIRVVAARTGTLYGHAVTAGDIYTVAGDGTEGFSGDGRPAAVAELNDPEGVAVDGAGDLFLADRVNERIRVVAAHSGTFYGQAMTAGDIYTVAGNAGLGDQRSGDGRPATTGQLDQPWGATTDHAGNLLLADSGNNRVQVVPVSTGTRYGRAMTAGHMYTVAGIGIQGFSGEGGPGTKAKLDHPEGVAADSVGNVVIADGGNQRIRVVAAGTGTFYGQAMTAGDIYTVAGIGIQGYSGDDGPAVKAKIEDPTGVAVDAAGNLVIADSGNERIRVVAAGTGTFYGQAMTAGDIYTVAGDGTEGFSGDGGPATSAELNFPSGVATDAAGNLVIADSGNERIRVVAAGTGTFYGQAMTAGDIYTVAGDGTEGFSGDGGPATAARLNSPDGVSADQAGNLVIADTGNSLVRVVAARTGSFYGVTMTARDIYEVAGGGGDIGTDGLGDGGPAIEAVLSQPEGVAVDGAGGLVIGDTGHNRIRMVTG